jgi:hypothetical protein
MGGKGKKKDDVEAEELVDDQCDEDSEIEEDEVLFMIFRLTLKKKFYKKSKSCHR